MQATLSHQVTLLGNLCAAERILRYFADGQALLIFDVQLNAKGKNGEQSMQFRVCARGPLAEYIAEKGQDGQGVWLQAVFKPMMQSDKSIISMLELTAVELCEGPTQLYWNRVMLVASIAHMHELARSTNNQDYLKLDVLAPCANKHALTCHFWGFPAKLLASKALPGSKLALEGELRNAKTPLQLSIHGHTCSLLSADLAD